MECNRNTACGNSEFPYLSEPKINFFLYPPMNPVTSQASISLEDALELDQPALKNNLFTVYVSVPYCRSRCHSCGCFRGFLPQGGDKDAFLNDYLDCLIRQMKEYASSARYENAQCGSVYIGGGTASVFAPFQVKRLIQSLRESFTLVPDIEINMEGNPVDFSLEYLRQIKECGVTRLSIGYQSGQDPMLEALNTSHRAEVGITAVKNALAVGFRTVNVDLLYNVPGQTKEDWQRDLKQVIALGPQSISPGDYVVFSGSKAEELIESGQLHTQHDVNTVNDWYRWTCMELEKNNYFEQVRGIFTQPGHEQKYVNHSCNQSYEIVGLGTGAYGFINGFQFRVTSDSELYKQQMKEGRFFEVDCVSKKSTEMNFMERYIIHNFYSAALDSGDFFKRFGKDPVTVFPREFEKLEKHELIRNDGGVIRLTELGKKWRRSIYYEFHSPEFKIDPAS